MFAVAWGFLIATGVFGVLLRLQVVAPMPGVSYGNILHAHSHTAFLGWVFNAFFALAYLVFVDERERKPFIWLFVWLQAATVGMLVAYPLQGYGAASLSFTTMHMAGAVFFAVRLWRRSPAAPATRIYLRAALIFMLVSGAGPIALGPLAVMDLRDAPAYDLAIYWYLHFQYNGWFIFFLVALLAHYLRHQAGAARALRRAFPYLAAGVALTFALSVLWVTNAPWVYALCIAGAAAQLAGCAIGGRGVWAVRREWGIPGTIPAALLTTAAAAFILKCTMQLAAALPALYNLAVHHYTVIGFLHWIFLVVVSPALVGIGATRGWLAAGRRLHAGLLLWLVGVASSQFALFYPPIATNLALPHLPNLMQFLLIAAALMLLGIIAIAPVGSAAPHAVSDSA